MCELVHRASSESLACTALVLTGPCSLRAEVVPRQEDLFMESPTEKQILNRAYEIWERNGRPEGRKMNFGIKPNRSCVQRKNAAILRKLRPTPQSVITSAQ